MSKSPDEKGRLNLALSQEMRDRLESLKKRTSADSLSEVIRNNAVAIENLIALIDQGFEITAVKEGSVKQLEFLFLSKKD